MDPADPLDSPAGLDERLAGEPEWLDERLAGEPEWLDERLAGEPEWLDEEHYLEPLDEDAVEDADADQAPVVADVNGRLWRIRRRGGWVRELLSAVIR